MVKDGTTTNEESNKLLLQINKTRVKIESNEKCLAFLLNHVLTADAVTILSKLGQNCNQAEIAEKTSFSKQKVNYWVNQFLRYQLIKLHTDGCPKFYRLTPIGQKKLMGSDGSQNPCIMEDYPMKFRIVKDFGRIKDWKKLGQPKNWKKYGLRIGNVMVVKTSQNIIIHTGHISGFSADACLAEAGSIRSSVQAILESRCGIITDYIPDPLHPPKFIFYNKEAEEIHAHFGNISTEGIDLDNSSPSKEFPESIQRQPHIEGDREFATNFIRQANRIAQINIDVKELKADVEIIKNTFLPILPGLESLIKSLREVTDLLKSKSLIDSSSIEHDKSGMVI